MNRKAEPLLDPRTGAAGHVNPPGNLRRYRFLNSVTGEFTQDPLCPASRRQVFARLRSLVIPQCPFVNLPETHRSRWGEGLTAEDMKKCVWIRPETRGANRISGMDRVGPSPAFEIRWPAEDKDLRRVVKEQASEAG